MAADHAGFELKAVLKEELLRGGHEVLDHGTHDGKTPCDYPDAAEAVGGSILAGKAERGIIVCGSGVGVCAAANKIPGVRAAICHDTYSAHQGVEHDDLNVLCLGGRIIGRDLAREVTLAFIGARFSEEERHRRRLEKLKAIEKRFLRAPH
jgi:ribose 5-phosphate isomerase B